MSSSNLGFRVLVLLNLLTLLNYGTLSLGDSSLLGVAYYSDIFERSISFGLAVLDSRALFSGRLKFFEVVSLIIMQSSESKLGIFGRRGEGDLSNLGESNSSFLLYSEEASLLCEL